MTLAWSMAAVGVLCVLGAWAALSDDNKFLGVILCVFAIAAAGLCIAIIFKNAKRLR